MTDKNEAIEKYFATYPGYDNEIYRTIFKHGYEAALAQPEPYKGLSTHMESATNGRISIDPVTGDVGITRAEAH